MSFTDGSNYSEGPLASEIHPPGTTVIVSVEDDLLVSNTGQPGQQTVQITADRSQNFRTGNNPNGYEITGISIASGAVHGETISVRLCNLENQHSPTVSSNCRHHPTPDNPVRVIRRTSYAIMLQRLSGQVTVGAAVIDREDPTSLPDWSIRDRHQLKNSQNTWEDATDGQAIRIEIRGRPRSAMTNLGRPTATPGNGTGIRGLAILDPHPRRSRPKIPVPGHADRITMGPQLDRHPRQRRQHGDPHAQQPHQRS